MRETTASILNNTRAMFISQIITWTSSFFLMMFLPRYLGADSYGQLYFAISLTTLAGMIIDLGLSSYFVKEVSRDRSKVSLFFMNGISLRFITWILAMTVIYLYTMMADYQGEELNLIFILGFGKLLEAFSDMSHRIFQSYERLAYRSIAVIIERVTLAVISVILLLSGHGAVTIAFVMTFSVLLNFIASIYLLPKLVTIKFSLDLSSWPIILRGSLPFLISIFFSFIYYRIDIIMLAEMTSDKVVGWYGASYKLFDTLMFFPAILHMAVLPVFSRLWGKSLNDFVQLARRSLDITVIISFGITCCFVALANPIIDFLFGAEQYSNSTIILQGLALTLPLVYANFIFATVDMTSDRQKELSAVSVIATFINIGLNFLMIPVFQKNNGNGAIGATISTLITEIFVMIMFIYLLPSKCFGKENIVVIIKSFMTGTASGIIIWFIDAGLNIWYLSGFIGLIIYSLLLISVNVLTKKELNLILVYLPRRWSESTSRLFNS